MNSRLSPFPFLSCFALHCLASSSSSPPPAPPIDFQYAFEASIILIYGFHRCSALSAVTSAMNATHNPFYDLHAAMASVNISLGEMTPMLEFYLESNGVNGSLIDNLVNKIRSAENASDAMFGAGRGSSQPDFAPSSYVMSHFEVSDSNFLPSFLALAFFFLLFRLLAYLVLYFKSTPKK